MNIDDSIIAGDIISYILESIENDNIEELESILYLIDFEHLSYENSLQLIISLLKAAQKVNNIKATNIIYNLNENFFPSNSPIQFMTILFLESRSDISLLGFLVNIVKIDFNFMDIVFELIKVNPIDSDNYNGSQLRIAFYRCWIIFPNPSLDTLEKLLKLAKNVNYDLADELSTKIREINNYAEIPEWMIGSENLSDPTNLSVYILPKESAVVLPEHKEYSGELVEVLKPSNELIDEMISHINDELIINKECDKPLDKDTIKNILLANYNSLSLVQKYELAKKFVQKRNAEAMGDDTTLFITLGPSCPFVGATLNELDYGGSRMFTFNQFEYDEDIDDFDIDENLHPSILKDWFKGYCMQCNLRIRRRWHAVRKAQKYGGWFGCFCSWECVKNNIIDFNAADPILLNLCDIYEEEMFNYGILDRIPDDEYLSYISNIMNINKHITSNENIELTINNQGISEVNDVIKPIEIEERDAPITLYYYYSESEEFTKNFIIELEQLVEYTPYPDGTLGTPVSLIKFDTDSIDLDEDLHISHNIENLPTTILYFMGAPQSKFVGSNIRPILDKINSILN